MLIILTEILYRQPVLGEDISLTILALDADIRSMKKEAVTVGDNEKTKFGKLKCTSCARF
jgi:hypothetical protein